MAETPLLRDSERAIIGKIIELNKQLLKDHGIALKSIRFKQCINQAGALHVDGYTVEWRHNINGRLK